MIVVTYMPEGQLIVRSDAMRYDSEKEPGKRWQEQWCRKIYMNREIFINIEVNGNECLVL